MTTVAILARLADRAVSLADDVRACTMAECIGEDDDNAQRLNLAHEHLLTAEALLRTAAVHKV
jgi:hypothetical protein